MIDFSKISRPNIFYKVLYAYVAVVLRYMYFRKFRILGRENIPADKKEGFLLICNHQNGLLDALSIIYSIAPREPVFLARGDIFQKDGLARVLRTLRILPAYRKRDVGTENLDKNDAIFEQAVKLMDEGVVIAIFPEAGHQNHHYLGTFKKGFARIAFGYEEAFNYSKNLKILPLGHHYCGYCGMKNDVLYTIGEPFTFEDLYDIYKEHPERGRYLLNQRARERVEALMLNVADTENYVAEEQLCEMYVPVYEKKHGLKQGSLKNDLIAKRAVNDELRAGNYGKMPQEGEEAASAVDEKKRSFVESLIAKAGTYVENLKRLKLDDRIVERGNTLGFISRTLLWIVLLPFLLVSGVINFVPHKLAVHIGGKIKDKMLVPSLQFGVGLITFLVWYLIIFAVIWIVFKKFWIALLALIALPVTMLVYHNLQVLTRKLVMRLRKYLYVTRRDKLFAETKKLRRDIMSDLDTLMN